MAVVADGLVRVPDGLKLCHIWGDPSWWNKVVVASSSFLDCEVPDYGRPWIAGLVVDDAGECDPQVRERLSKWQVPVAELGGKASMGKADLDETDWCSSPWKIYGDGPRVVLYDLGARATLFRELSRRSLTITVLPPEFPASEVEELRPEAIMFAGGPWKACEFAEPLKAARLFMGKRPLLGIGSGLLLLGTALGVSINVMDKGHWGTTDVVDLRDGRKFSTLQSHQHTLDMKSLRRAGAVPELVSAEDGTVEGFSDEALKVYAAQFSGAFKEGKEGTDILDQILSMTRMV